MENGIFCSGIAAAQAHAYGVGAVIAAPLRSRAQVGLPVDPHSGVVENLDDQQLCPARHHAHHAVGVVDRVGGTRDVRAVTVAIFIPVLTRDLRPPAGDNALKIVMGAVEAGINDAEFHTGAIRRAGINHTVAIHVPHIARLHHVHVPGDYLRVGGHHHAVSWRIADMFDGRLFQQPVFRHRLHERHLGAAQQRFSLSLRQQHDHRRNQVGGEDVLDLAAQA
ncbi:MAG: hypothetical protein BWY63_01589 [Chloroflexi bacterium ADurb.Bin360]|nr:MAG: hypothetical protein BWY63_01589 [Chloroflexi bacterium ADurb.Bin360]